MQRKLLQLRVHWEKKLTFLVTFFNFWSGHLFQTSFSHENQACTWKRTIPPWSITIKVKMTAKNSPWFPFGEDDSPRYKFHVQHRPNKKWWTVNDWEATARHEHAQSRERLTIVRKPRAFKQFSFPPWLFFFNSFIILFFFFLKNFYLIFFYLIFFLIRGDPPIFVFSPIFFFWKFFFFFFIFKLFF